MDYTFKAPSLADLGAALTALQQAGLVGAADRPNNMLGSLSVNDANGFVLFRYGVGRPASTATAPDGSTISLAAIGDPAMFYVAIRTDVPPSAIPFDPTTLGLIATTPDESAAVLGVWA